MSRTPLAESRGMLGAADAWVAGGGRISGELLQTLLEGSGIDEALDETAPLPTPATLFDAFVGGRDSAARRVLESVFEMVVGPGEPVDPAEVRPGDMLIRAAPGEGISHLAMVGPRGAVPGEMLAAEGMTGESRGAGLYVHVIEGGAFAHGSRDGYTRRIAGADGRLDHDSVVLRLRSIRESAQAEDAARESDGREPEDDTSGEDTPFPPERLSWPGSTPEQLAFMREVYRLHVARSSARRHFVADVPGSELATVEGGHRARTDTAADCRALLAECRAERRRQQEAGDERARRVTAIGVVSAYRSASQQLAAWQGNFPKYYRRTQSERAAKAGGEHGARAAAYLAGYIGKWLAAPGFSLHNAGRAIDFTTTEGGTPMGASSSAANRAAWRRSWMWEWITANAARFRFFQNTAIDEPWHWEHHPAGGEAAQEAADNDEAIEAALEAAELEDCGCPPGTHERGAHESAIDAVESLLDPAPVADARYDTDPAENALPWPPFTVLDADARVRGGPPNFSTTGGRIPQWTRAYQIDLQRGYVRLAGADRTDLGWTKRSNVGMFFKDIPHLTTTALIPATAVTPDPRWPALRRALCEAFNRLGGLLGAVAADTGTPVAAALAVWYVESGGRSHTPGAAIIRFENHLFWDAWGSEHPADYDAHFQHGGRAGVSGERWKNHRWREGVSGPFHTFHGNQDREYQVLSFSAGLAGFATAVKCISIGGPQILVSNHRMIGYATPTEMYNAFQGQDERWQVLGFFDFCQFKFRHGSRRGELLRALRARDWRTFARGYNGSGKVEEYAGKLRNAYDQAMILLGSPADPPEPRAGAWFLPQPSEAMGEALATADLAESGIAPGRSEVATLPLLAPHYGTPPDLVVRWNDMGAAPDSVDVVVHLHGYSGRAAAMRLPRDKEPISGLDWSNPADPADRTPGRRLPTVGMLPRGRYFGGRHHNAFDFPALTTSTGIRDLVAAGLAEFARAMGTSTPAMRRLILTAHSGGGAALMRVLQHNDPHEVHVFDALYGPAGVLIDWARRRITADAAAVGGQPHAIAEAYMRERGGALRVLYIPDTDTQAHSLAVHRALDSALRGSGFAPFPLGDWYRVQATGVGHPRMPRHYGWRLLADAASALPHTRTPRAPAGRP